MTRQGNAPLPERREFGRLHKQFVVRVTGVDDRRKENRDRVVAEEHMPWGEARGTNISLGGIALETNMSYRPGSMLSLEILLPEPEVRAPPEPPPERRLFRVQCEVIWCRQVEEDRFATGLRFVDLGEEQLKVLSRLIARGIE